MAYIIYLINFVCYHSFFRCQTRRSLSSKSFGCSFSFWVNWTDQSDWRCRRFWYCSTVLPLAPITGIYCFRSLATLVLAMDLHSSAAMTSPLAALRPLCNVDSVHVGSIPRAPGQAPFPLIWSPWDFLDLFHSSEAFSKTNRKDVWITQRLFIFPHYNAHFLASIVPYFTIHGALLAILQP